MGFGGHGKGKGRSAEMPSEKDLSDGMEGVKPAKVSRLFTVAKPEWPWLALGLVLLVGSLSPTLVLPLAFGKMMDEVNSSSGRDAKIESVDTLVKQLFVLLVLSAICTMLRSFVFNTAGERVVARLRIRLFTAIVSQEIGMFDKRKTGELLSRLSTDTTSLQDTATSNVSMFFRGLVMLTISGALMFFTSWRLSLLIFTVVPAFVVSTVLYGRAVKGIAIKYSDALGRATDIAQETITNVRTMRSFAAEELEVAKYKHAVGDPDAKLLGTWCWVPPANNKSSYYYGVWKHVLSSTFMAFVTTMGFGACILVVWVGARFVIEGYMTVGELVAFMLYAVQIGASCGMMMGLVSSLFVAAGASRRTFQLIDRPPQIPIATGDYPDTPVKGHIVFEDVHFSYPTRPDVVVLAGFSIEIPVNATYAFVGTSGAGKSTVLSLLLRFYDVTSGRILIDDHDIRSLDPRYLRRSMALVAQEPVLFGETVAKNIAYGWTACAQDLDAEPLHADVEAAAKAAFAHEFVTSFPDGYNTLVGERGVRLSGGQKQRIAIARALMVNPRVLLLDEATSALDAESEHLVQRAIDAVMMDRTTLIVAHRLSTVRHANSIVVVEGGRIDAVGPHSELLGSCKTYQDLVKRQLQAQSGNDTPGCQSHELSTMKDLSIEITEAHVSL